jgi:hypothetical protein
MDLSFCKWSLNKFAIYCGQNNDFVFDLPEHSEQNTWKAWSNLKCKFSENRIKLCNRKIANRRSRNPEHENVNLRNWICGSRSFSLKIAIFPLFQLSREKESRNYLWWGECGECQMSFELICGEFCECWQRGELIGKLWKCKRKLWIFEEKFGMKFVELEKTSEIS